MILLNSSRKEPIEIVNAYNKEYGIDDAFWDDFELNQEDFVEIEDFGYILKDDLEQIARIDSYYSCSDIIDSSHYIYKVENDEMLYYVSNPCNDDRFYNYDNLDDLDESEVFYQCDDEFKELYFGDRLKDIKAFVEIRDENVNYVKRISIVKVFHYQD
jgi:hypothetical protein